jgi:hypothetical protein
VITLVTNNPLLATVPAHVTIASGQSAGTFTVKTEPVATLTTFTLTARMKGSPDASTTFTATPPALAGLDCDPTSVSGGSHATCKASMNGPVAAGAAAQIGLSTSNAQIVSLSATSVTVPSGSRSATFDVRAADLPQSASAKISATYAGVTKTSSITVTPAAISSFGCTMSTDLAQKTQCSVVGGLGTPGTRVWFVVRLTAPAPPSGYEIPLTLAVLDANGKPITMPPWMDAIQRGMKVPAGKTEAFYAVCALPVKSTAVIQVTAKDPMSTIPMTLS